jgi:hypothetical protein
MGGPHLTQRQKETAFRLRAEGGVLKGHRPPARLRHFLRVITRPLEAQCGWRG